MKKVLVAIELLAVLAVFGVVGAFGYASWETSRVHGWPEPALQASRDPAPAARGKKLFQGACARCHVDPASGRATGTLAPDWPSWAGRFHGRNLTNDGASGIGSLSDEDLARTIRAGLLAGGAPAIGMPSFPRMSDDDVVAIVTFLRSPDPMLAADSHEEPRSDPSVRGTLLLAFLRPARKEGCRTGIAAPPAAATADYGRYLADDVYECWSCHDGRWGDARGTTDFYSGGLLLEDASGAIVPSVDLTPAGLGSMDAAQLARALRDGVDPAGDSLRAPMPRYPLLDDVDVQAILAYLRTLPVALGHATVLPSPRRAPATPVASNSPAMPAPTATPIAVATTRSTPTPRPKATPKPKKTPVKKKHR